MTSVLFVLLSTGCSSTNTLQSQRVATPSHPRSEPPITVGNIRYSAGEIAQIQRSASRRDKRYLAYLNPNSVVARTLPRLGFTGPVPIYSPLTVPITANGRPYQVLLTQPLHAGPTGVWSIYGVIPLGQRNKGVNAPALRVRVSEQAIKLIQEGSDKGVGRDRARCNPLLVVMHDLPRYGFRHIQIAPRLSVHVNQGLESYDVDLVQPARHGLQGVWLVWHVESHEVEKGADKD